MVLVPITCFNSPFDELLSDPLMRKSLHYDTTHHIVETRKTSVGAFIC